MMEQLKNRWRASGNPPETHQKPAGNQPGAQRGGFSSTKDQIGGISNPTEGQFRSGNTINLVIFSGK
jgi:hypothetical protein